MSSDSHATDPDTTGGDPVADEPVAVDAVADGAVADDAVADDAVADDAGSPSVASGVAAKAARRAAATEGRAGGREFTVTARSLWRALAALAVVGLLVAVGVLGQKTWSLSRTLDAFGETKAVSQSFVQEYFEAMMAPNTTAQQIQDAILPLTTGEAGERLKAESEETVKWVAEAQLANVKVEVTAVMVESFTSTTATTVVAATLTGTSALQPAGGSNAFLLDLDLVKENGTWLVSRMTGANGAGVGAGADGAQTGGGQPADPTTPQPEPAPAG